LNQQQVRKIKEFAEKLSGLCDGEAIPSHKPDAIKLPDVIQLNSTNLAAERMMYQVAETIDKAQRAYRERVLALLEADADDWVFIARIFEDLRPQWFSRIDSLRQNILLHTDPDKKYQNWLEPQKGKLNPNKYLRDLIEQFRDKFLYEADLAGRQKYKRVICWIFKKTSHFILTLIITIISGLLVAVVTDILGDFGWIGKIKIIIYNIFTSK
jgi:hypothetical protein